MEAIGSSRVLVIMLALVGLCCSGDLEAQVTWRRTYGGFGSQEASSVRQTSDGGYIIAGATGSFGNGAGDMYVVRVDAMGDPLWSRTYGGTGVETNVACRELTDGYILSGTTSLGNNGGYDLLLIRTDLLGEPIWERHYGGADWDLCNAFDVFPDGFVLGGISYGPDVPQGAAFIVRTDLNGDTLWTRKLVGPMLIECGGLAAVSDGGVIAVGRKETTSGYDDAYFTKLGPNGIEQWTTVVGGDSSEYLLSVVENGTGGFTASGGTDSFSPTRQIYLAQVDALGQFQWEEDQGSVADAAATEIRNDHNGGFVFTGYNTLNLGERDMILTVTDANGMFQFGYNYGDSEPADGHSIDPTDDGGYVVAGWSENYGPGLRAMYVAKTDSFGLTASLMVESYLDPLRVQETIASSFVSIHPNPAAPGTTIRLNVPVTGVHFGTIQDMHGRTVVPRFAITADGSTLPSLTTGPYILSFSNATGVQYRARLFVVAE